MGKREKTMEVKKMIVNYGKDIVMRFGTGDIGISLKVYTHKEDESKLGAVLFSNEEPRTIGETVNREEPEDIKDCPVVMTFTDTKSIDVVISQLQAVKELMLEDKEE